MSGHRPGRSGAFTLAEVLLVLVVGAVLLGGATLLFAQVRDNAATAQAQEKVSALQALIEEYRAADPGDFPSAQWVADHWELERESDFDMSPWGGQVQCPNPGCTLTTSSSGASIADIRDIVVSSEGTYLGDSSEAGDEGVLDYIHWSPAMVPKGESGSAFLCDYDYYLSLWVYTSNYAVAIEDQAGRQYNFVKGPPYCPPAGFDGADCVSPQATSSSFLSGSGNGSYNQ